MIRVAIVGTGNISHAHVNSYLLFPQRCRIVALVDIVPEKAQAMKEKYGLDADVYDDHLSILGRNDIDLVDVCTPPYVHAQISINAMNHGNCSTNWNLQLSILFWNFDMKCLTQ